MAIKKTSFEIQEAEGIGSGEVVPWGTSPYGHMEKAGAGRKPNSVPAGVRAGAVIYLTP